MDFSAALQMYMSIMSITNPYICVSHTEFHTHSIYQHTPNIKLPLNKAGLTFFCFERDVGRYSKFARSSSRKKKKKNMKKGNQYIPHFNFHSVTKVLNITSYNYTAWCSPPPLSHCHLQKCLKYNDVQWFSQLASLGCQCSDMFKWSTLPTVLPTYLLQLEAQCI